MTLRIEIPSCCLDCTELKQFPYCGKWGEADQEWICWRYRPRAKQCFSCKNHFQLNSDIYIVDNMQYCTRCGMIAEKESTKKNKDSKKD